MHKLNELKEKLMNELEDYADNGKFSKDDVEAIKYTASAIDHICNIVERTEEDGGQSSYARGGRRRDAMGRYSGRRSYSYDDDMRSLADSVRSMMDDMPEETRSEARRFVQKLDRM